MKNLFQSKKNIIIPALVILVGFFLTCDMAVSDISRKEAESRSHAEMNAKVYAGHLASDMERGIAITNALEQAVIATHGNLEDFQAIAANMQQDYVQSIQIAPAGVVTEICPAEGNEAGLGDLIHRDDLRGITCRYARDNDVVIMQGPFNLFQGGSGIAIRNPVFLERDGRREFWGFTIVIIRVPEIFAGTVGDLTGFGYAYRLRKTVSPIDPSLMDVYSSEAPLPENPAGYSFWVGDSYWRLETAPVAGWYNPREILESAILYMLLYILLALAIYLVLSYRERQEEKQLRLAAERGNRAKGTFLMRMSHDIRTPLNGIMGMIEMAEQHEDNKEMLRECRRKAKAAGMVLLELVNEVLDMSKLESGEIMLEHVAFDPEEVCESVATMVNRQAQSRGIEIVKEKLQLEHRHLLGSPVHLRRILTNIVMNAIKYNKENGKIYLSCQEISTSKDGVMLRFTCRDTGIGMTEDFMEHIFEPFTQENATARTQYGGTGLGMSIAESLVSKMGGSITVDSRKGEGSTFEVILSFDIDHSYQAEEKQPEAEQDISLKGYSILLAEDNELNMEIAKFLLEEHGAKVLPAANGQEAVDIFDQSQEFELDIVLMDIMMPVMNGHQAARAIRQLQRPDAAQVPIIAITANAFAEDKAAAREAGMNDHLAKPLESGLVLEAVDKWVRWYRQGR